MELVLHPGLLHTKSCGPPALFHEVSWLGRTEEAVHLSLGHHLFSLLGGEMLSEFPEKQTEERSCLSCSCPATSRKPHVGGSVGVGPLVS